MRTGVALSAIVHLCLFLLFLGLGAGLGRERGYPVIYRVNLVGSFGYPGGGRVAGGGGGAPERGKKEISAPAEGEGEKATKKRGTEPPSSNGSLGSERGRGSGYGFGSGKGTSLVGLEGGSGQSSYYLDIILSKIGENWRNPYEGPLRLTAQVYFRIGRNGEIAEVKLERGSGQSAFDQAVVRAVYATKRLPPLPQEFRGEYLGVHFEFEYAQ
jgi:TonB family protein